MHDLLQLMYQDGHLSSTELAALRRTSRQLRENPVRILRSLNVATPGEIRELLQRYYGFPAATDKVIEEMDESMRAMIPADIALHYCVLPIAEENGDLYVLMEDPTDKGVISQLQFFLDRKIIPVIATVVQLSNGLCRLYGVEPGRLKLSGLLEASRGAVGVSSGLNLPNTHFVDDSQPLLDDEVFKRLKAKPKKKAQRKISTGQEPDAVTEVAQAPSDVIQPVSPNTEEPETAGVQALPTPAPEAEPNEEANESRIHVTDVEVDPELVSALNVVGLRLALANNRTEAISMANERLGEFSVHLEHLPTGKILVVWKGASQEIDLERGISEAPQLFRALLKKISQCRAE